MSIEDKTDPQISLALDWEHSEFISRASRNSCGATPTLLLRLPVGGSRTELRCYRLWG
jgi:hypothetical protein